MWGEPLVDMAGCEILLGELLVCTTGCGVWPNNSRCLGVLSDGKLVHMAGCEILLGELLVDTTGCGVWPNNSRCLEVLSRCSYLSACKRSAWWSAGSGCKNG